MQMPRTSLHGRALDPRGCRALMSVSALLAMLSLPQRSQSFLAPSHAAFVPHLHLQSRAQSCLVSPRSLSDAKHPNCSLCPLKHVCSPETHRLIHAQTNTLAHERTHTHTHSQWHAHTCQPNSTVIWTQEARCRRSASDARR